MSKQATRTWRRVRKVLGRIRRACKLPPLESGIYHPEWLISPLFNYFLEERSSGEARLRRRFRVPLPVQAWDLMTFNDKVRFRLLHLHDPFYQTCCDRLAMRRYVAARLGEDALPLLLHVAPSSDAFDDRTGPFVLKANHGSGWVTFMDKGQTLSGEEKQRADAWLRETYGEWGYLSARRLLLAEERLFVPGTNMPPDYKLFCFSGRVEMIQVDLNRFTDHRQTLMLPNWVRIRGRNLCYSAAEDCQMPRPPNLDTMLEWASILSRGIDFIRVDLYDLGDRVVVGELTPYPLGGRARYRPFGLDIWLGRKWARPAVGGYRTPASG